jgi:hypothetical protein
MEFYMLKHKSFSPYILIAILFILNPQICEGSWLEGLNGILYYRGGNVGIGTNDPESKLSVLNGGIHLKDENSQENNGWKVFSTSANHYPGPGVFSIHEEPTLNSNSGGYRFVVAPGGMIGINTVSPSSELEVDGTITSGKICVGTSENPQKINLSDGGIWLNHTKNPQNYGWQLYTTSTDHYPGAGKLAFLENEGSVSNGKYRLVIAPGGKIGINTISPQSELSVDGTITAKAIRVTVEGWPDYVFNPHYSLPPIKDVEIFINKNKRLPEMPSAEEISRDGLPLADMQKKLVKKVEELTLYLIEQSKTLQKQSEEIERLKEENKKIRATIGN